MHALTSNGFEVTVEIEDGKHRGPILVVRYTCGTVVLGVKAEHATATVLGSVFDPGTVTTVLDFVARAV
jgi:hypothetical protein